MAFSGKIWKMAAHPHQPVLFFEIRDEENKTVTFSALNTVTRALLFTDLSLEEKWWVTLEDVRESILLVKFFNDAGNPEKTTLIGLDFLTGKMAWWKSNFVLQDIGSHTVLGVDQTIGQFRTLDILTGEPTTRIHGPVVQNFSIQKPLQYYAHSSHFETVKLFLQSRLKILAVSLIEYMEFDGFIVMSVYCKSEGLANFLIVLNVDGEVLLKELMGERLAGIGLDTFFVFAGTLFFVKEKSELVSYKLV
jgi:hypothetical protein